MEKYILNWIIQNSKHFNPLLLCVSPLHIPRPSVKLTIDSIVNVVIPSWHQWRLSLSEISWNSWKYWAELPAAYFALCGVFTVTSPPPEYLMDFTNMRVTDTLVLFTISASEIHRRFIFGMPLNNLIVCIGMVGQVSLYLMFLKLTFNIMYNGRKIRKRK